MRIAVPIAGGRVSAHFGHCDQFGLFDTEDCEIRSKEYLSPPAHEPGAFPRWLKDQGANLVISCGMGQRAQRLFTDQGIQVEKRMVLLAEAIKNLGTFQVSIRVYKEVEPEITVEVVPE